MRSSILINAVLSLAGFGCTWLAAWNASRYQLSGANAGLQEWGIVAGLLAVAAVCLAVRVYNRFHASVLSGFSPAVPRWIPSAIAERSTARDTESIRRLADLIDATGKGKVQT